MCEIPEVRFAATKYPYIVNALPSGSNLVGSGLISNEREIQMTTGTVKFFNSSKGYGFIQPDDGSKDAFVHISAVERSGLTTLNEGQKVTYDLEAGRDGKTSATNLQLAD